MGLHYVLFLLRLHIITCTYNCFISCCSSDEFSSIVITTPGGTSDFNLVDGEDLTVAFATTQTGVHTVQLVDSSGNVGKFSPIQMTNFMSLDVEDFIPRKEKVVTTSSRSISPVRSQDTLSLYIYGDILSTNNI